MSKYVQFDCKKIRNLETLLAALAAFGWDSGKVEVHDTPQALYGYSGDKRNEKANVIIRRNNTGVGASNDVGFVLGPDGSYKAIVSEYDQNAIQYSLNRQHLEDGFVKGVERQYGKITGEKALSTVLLHTIPQMKQRRLIPRHATATKVTDGKITKIVVRY